MSRAASGELCFHLAGTEPRSVSRRQRVGLFTGTHSFIVEGEARAQLVEFLVPTRTLFGGEAK